MMLRFLRYSRYVAAVALLALIAGQWLSCSCAAPAEETGHQSTAVQDPHACCDTDAGLRAGSTCCSERTLHRESAVIASTLDTDPILTPAAHATEMTETVTQRATRVPALPAGATRPPLSVILRI